MMNAWDGSSVAFDDLCRRILLLPLLLCHHILQVDRGRSLLVLKNNGGVFRQVFEANIANLLPTFYEIFKDSRARSI